MWTFVCPEHGLVSVCKGDKLRCPKCGATPLSRAAEFSKPEVTANVEEPQPGSGDAEEVEVAGEDNQPTEKRTRRARRKRDQGVAG